MWATQNVCICKDAGDSSASCLHIPVCASTTSHCADNPIADDGCVTSASPCCLNRNICCHGFILKQLLLCTTPKMCCLHNRMAQLHVSTPNVLLWEKGQTCISIACASVTKVGVVLILQYAFQCCICMLCCYMCDLPYSEALAKHLRLVLPFHEHCFTLWRPSE